MDNATATQRKIFALALSIILTLRVPQVIDKLDDILRYIFLLMDNEHLLHLLAVKLMILVLFTRSVCTSVILGGSGELSEEDPR